MTRLSFRWQFVLLLVSVLTIIWSLIGFDLYRVYRQSIVTSEIQVQNLARAFAEEVTSSVKSIDLSLIDLRDRWNLKNGDFNQAVKQRQAYLEQDVGFQVAVIDATGILAYSSRDPAGKPVDLSDREHFRVHKDRATDQLFISKPIFGRVTKRWSIQFTRPIIDRSGRFAGVIVLSVAPEYFSRFFNTIDLGKESTIAVLRIGGEMLARSPNPDRAIGQVFGEHAFLEEQRANQGGYRRPSVVDGIERIYFWRTLPRGGLAVVVGQSIETALTPYYRRRETYSAAGIGLSLLFAAIAYVLLSSLHLRRENERALRDSLDQLKAEQSRIRVILENSHDAFIAVDHEGRITDWNKKAERTFGWTATEVLGKELSGIIIPEEQRAAHAVGFRRFVSTGESRLVDTVIEVEALHRSGKRIPVELALAGFYNGKAYAANAFIRDISERKKAERLDRERLQALEETRKALQQSQKLEALGRLTGGIAHDFNNVLQTLTTGIHVALISIKDEKIQSILKASERAVKKGVELTRQLLDFGRVQDANLQTVQLASQINGMIPLLQGALPSNIRLDLSLDPHLWMVQIDPLQFELALLNLAMNSRDAMSNGGTFKVEARNHVLTTQTSELPAGDYVQLIITDTGEGMTPEVMAKALDPFFTTKEVGKGSGMGLAQVYGFVRQMDGNLILQSQPGKGLQVSIYLPKAKSSVPSESAEKSSFIQGAAGHGSILFVEDDPLVQETVKPALETAGFNIMTANNA